MLSRNDLSYSVVYTVQPTTRTDSLPYFGRLIRKYLFSVLKDQRGIKKKCKVNRWCVKPGMFTDTYSELEEEFNDRLTDKNINKSLKVKCLYNNNFMQWHQPF